METLNRPSFNEIGEMTCITHAWLSPGETLKPKVEAVLPSFTVGVLPSSSLSFSSPCAALYWFVVIFIRSENKTMFQLIYVQGATRMKIRRGFISFHINFRGRLQHQQVWDRGKGQKAGPPIY